MIAMTLREIAGVTGGAVAEEAAGVVVTGPAFLDSRQPVEGGLFLAIAGEHADGHEFAASALAGGAVAVLGSRAVPGPAVVVEDVQRAVGLLAAHVLRELRRASTDLRVLAVTGSAGKTGVKDALGAVLAAEGPTV